MASGRGGRWTWTKLPLVPQPLHYTYIYNTHSGYYTYIYNTHTHTHTYIRTHREREKVGSGFTAAADQDAEWSSFSSVLQTIKRDLLKNYGMKRDLLKTRTQNRALLALQSAALPLIGAWLVAR
jgi:hypothetical protein